MLATLRRYGTGLVVVYVAALLLMELAPTTGPWLALHVVAVAVAWVTAVGLVCLLVDDVVAWVRRTSIRHAVGVSAFNVILLGPPMWLVFAGWWWVTGTLAAMAWVLVVISVQGLVGGFIRGLRSEATAEAKEVE